MAEQCGYRQQPPKERSVWLPENEWTELDHWMATLRPEPIPQLDLTKVAFSYIPLRVATAAPTP